MSYKRLQDGSITTCQNNTVEPFSQTHALSSPDPVWSIPHGKWMTNQKANVGDVRDRLLGRIMIFRQFFFEKSRKYFYSLTWYGKKRHPLKILWKQY